MTADVLRAELFGLRRRPGVWILTAVWSAQIIVFAYLVAYLVYRFVPELTPEQAQQMRTSLLPASIGNQMLGSMPVYGGPVMLIIGALVAAGDYRWGTLRTILGRYAARTSLLLARFGAMALVFLLLSVLTLVVSALCSVVLALVEGETIVWPGPGSIALSVLALWLVCTAWGGLGFALGIVTRSIAAAIGIGLLWTLMVENLIGGLAGLLPVLETVRTVLLSAATGSLAADLGSSTVSEGGGPGVVATMSGAAATAVLLGYVALTVLVSCAVFRRRDVT
jgi:ABC-type transport system involved in multi-copper enzyme maturation permease subunit